MVWTYSKTTEGSGLLRGIMVSIGPLALHLQAVAQQIHVALAVRGELAVMLAVGLPLEAPTLKREDWRTRIAAGPISFSWMIG